ncbi:hypothetical protein IAD21_06169 [Abditibacteriota bacterium]|nr:hypothetical protein IAD21_06169 [Abditibacteriota bacterium]
MDISQWMSWIGGVDLVAATAPDLEMPNVIVHVANLVTTPISAAPSGLIFLPDFEDVAAPPTLMGFITGDETVGAYFGPNIFAGTPFEAAPVLRAQISTQISQSEARARIEVGDMLIETHMFDLENAEIVHRAPGGLPFFQQGVEQRAGRVELRVNGTVRGIFVPEIGMTGGPGAVVAPCGLYAR